MAGSVSRSACRTTLFQSLERSRLLDQSLLEGLDFLEHLPSIWVGSLQLSPSVAVEWVFQLFGEGLDLESLGQELLLEVIDLLSQVWDLRGLGLHDSQLRLVVSDLELLGVDLMLHGKREIRLITPPNAI